MASGPSKLAAMTIGLSLASSLALTMMFMFTEAARSFSPWAAVGLMALVASPFVLIVLVIRARRRTPGR